MDRHVKGSLFQEYVRMVRKNKQVDWSQYLESGDMEYLNRLILPSQWYPYGVYQRLGAAIFHELAGRNPEVARSWGRYTMEGMAELYGKNLIEMGDPKRTLKKFHAIYMHFFDFEGFTIDMAEENRAEIKINPAFGKLAVQGYTYQMLGSFHRLIELSGAKDVRAEFVKKMWDGAQETVISIQWSANQS